ncbi:MAG: carbamoyltransferase HypF, partial [Bacteroidota bacterium]
FTELELKIYKKLHANSQLKSSSMGRVFDTVASLLDLCDVQAYEAEAAMKLEALAYNFFEKDLDFWDHYEISLGEGVFDVRPMLQAIIKEKEEGFTLKMLAAKFHNSLVQLIKKVADTHGIKKIACSGGVFQNALLIDLCIERLGEDYELYFHQQLSPNDENIAYGQLILANLFKI